MAVVREGKKKIAQIPISDESKEDSLKTCHQFREGYVGVFF